MDQDALKKWDDRYSTDQYVYGKGPDRFIVEQVAAWKPGRALCLAAGEGRNAVYLAQEGYDVTALDISVRGIEKCRALAAEKGVTVEGVQADALEFAFPEAAFDLVTNIFFLERALYPGIMTTVKPGGHLLLQTYTRDQVQLGWGPSSPDFLLAPNELLETFGDFRVRHYWEGEERREDARQAALARIVVEMAAV